MISPVKEQYLNLEVGYDHKEAVLEEFKLDAVSLVLGQGSGRSEAAVHPLEVTNLLGSGNCGHLDHI